MLASQDLHTVPEYSKLSGVFAAACFIHTGFQPTVGIVNGKSYLLAAAQWWSAVKSSNVNGVPFDIDTCGVLCNPTCPHN